MNDGTPLKSWEALQPENIFRELPSWLEHGQGWLIAASFLVLVSGHLWRMHEAGQKGKAVLEQWYRTLLVLAFALTSPILARWAQEASAGIERGLPGPSAAEVSRRCLQLASTYPAYDTLLEAPPGSPDRSADQVWDVGGWREYADMVVDGGLHEQESDRWVSEGGISESAWLAAEATVERKAQSLFLSYTITVSSLVAAGAAAWLMEMVRFLVLHFGAWLLPLFVCSLRAHFLRAFALRSLALMAVAHGWPVLWKLGHFVTAALFDRWVSLYVGPGGAATDWKWNMIENATLLEEGPSWLARVGAGVPADWLLATSLGALGLLGWVVLVTVAAPWLSYRLAAKSTES